MEDRKIIELFFSRDENAIREVEAKYGRFCFSIAHHVLNSREDAEECVNDAYLGLWNAIPPECPENLKAYVGKVTRNISLTRLEHNLAGKRADFATVSISELEEILPDDHRTELPDEDLAKAINSFLKKENRINRNVFLRRYWYFDSIAEISARSGFSESKVKSILHRTRVKLKKYLEKEGCYK